MELNAYYSMGLVGYEVGVDDSGETAYYRYTFGNDKVHRAKIYFTQNGRAYFMARGKRIHLDECLRKNI